MGDCTKTLLDLRGIKTYMVTRKIVLTVSDSAPAGGV